MLTDYRHRLALVLALGLATSAEAQLVPAATATSTATAASTAAASTTVSTAPSLLQNLELFVGLDGSKQPQDLGINANMGVRLAANFGLPVVESIGLGAQLGGAVNLSDAAVHVLDQIEGTSRRSQTYLTLGLFQKNGSPLSWSLGYDWLHERYYDAFALGQLRGQAGVRVSPTDELGGWFSKGVKSDQGVMGTTAVRLDPITQLNAYLSHDWPTTARTTVWAGVANHHHNIVWVLPDNSRSKSVVVYGASLEMPLSHRFSVTGSSNFVTPTATGTVDAYLGLTYHPGRGDSFARGRFQPLTPVANNPEFPVDLSR